MGLVAWTEGGAGGEGGVPYEDGKFLAETSAGEGRGRIRVKGDKLVCLQLLTVVGSCVGIDTVNRC